MKLGDWVYLKTGSPRLLVVDVFAATYEMKCTVAYKIKTGAKREFDAPARCFTPTPTPISKWESDQFNRR